MPGKRRQFGKWVKAGICGALVILLVLALPVMAADHDRTASSPKSAPEAPEMRLIREGRPANLYRLYWQNAPELCSKILGALNEPYKSSFQPQVFAQIPENYMISDLLLHNKYSADWIAFDGYEKEDLQLKPLMLKRCFHYDLDQGGVIDTIIRNHGYSGGRWPKYYEGVFISSGKHECSNKLMTANSNIDSVGAENSFRFQYYKLFSEQPKFDIFDISIIDTKAILLTGSQDIFSRNKIDQLISVYSFSQKKMEIQCVVRRGAMKNDNKGGPQ